MHRTMVVSSGVLLLTVSGTVGATRTFVGPGSQWSDATYWFPQFVPTATDVAIIPVDKICEINNNYDAVALRIELKYGTGIAAGALKINQGSTLTLHGEGDEEASVIEGVLSFVDEDDETDASILKLQNDHVIKAGSNQTSSAAIEGVVDGIIDKGVSGASLTLKSSQNQVLIVHGSLDIKVELVNNATINTNSDRTLKLTGDPKSGTGFWKSTHGTLEVDATVTGAGNWIAGEGGVIKIMEPCTIDAGSGTGYIQVINGQGSSFIVDTGGEVQGSAPWTLSNGTVQIKTACTDLTGDFTINTGGTLDVDARFCTTGNLTNNGGTIDVAEGLSSVITITWGGTCP